MHIPEIAHVHNIQKYLITLWTIEENSLKSVLTCLLCIMYIHNFICILNTIKRKRASLFCADMRNHIILHMKIKLNSITHCIMHIIYIF